MRGIRDDFAALEARVRGCEEADQLLQVPVAFKLRVDA
jgi:hypothetical protein